MPIKSLHDNRGVALLTVMSIMAVLLIIGSLVLSMASSESRLTYDYGNNARAFYVAEAGADLAIYEWEKYIDSLPDQVDDEGIPTGVLAVPADIDAFLDELDAQRGLAVDDPERNEANNPRYELERKIRNNYSVGDNNQTVLIYFDCERTGILDPYVDSDDMLYIKVAGSYDDAVFDYEVKLWYYANGDFDSYKGSSDAVVTPVEPVPVTGVTLSPTLLTLSPGVSYTLSYSVTPVNATNKNVTWSSSNPAVATVNNGVVTAVATGTTTITVTTMEGGFIAVCEVDVITTSGPVTGEIDGPAYLENLIVDDPQLTINDDLTVLNNVEVINDGILAITGGDGTQSLYVGNTYTSQNSGSSIISNLQEVEIGSDMIMENNTSVDFTNIETIDIGRHLTMDNSGEVNYTNVDEVIIAGDFILSNNTTVVFHDTPKIIVGGNLSLDNNSTIKVTSGITKVYLGGTFDLKKPNSNIEVSEGASIFIYDMDSNLIYSKP